MNPLGSLALFSLIPVIFLLFALFPSRQAVIYSALWGWLFVPFRIIPMPGLTEYSKMSALPLGILLATPFFDANRLLKLRPKIWDLPALIFTICPIFTSLHNDLGLHDGLAGMASQFSLWTGAYLVGRIYFTDLEGMRDLAFGFVIGGLLYVPLCLYEIRMSPQLNMKIYGFITYEFSQSIRLGGYRPVVFMEHGIAVGNWMMSATIVAVWLWMCRTFTFRWHFPAKYWVLALVVTTAIMHSIEAVALVAVAMGTLLAVKWFGTRWGLILLMLAPPIYCYARTSEVFTGDYLVQTFGQISPDRAKSLEVRLHNEDLLTERAMESPVYGWGGYDRFEVLNSKGQNLAVPDQFWVIEFGQRGLVGLIALEAMLLVPCLVLMLRVPVRYWTHPAVAPALVLAVVVALHMWDCLLNAFVNPIFMMACGAVTGMLPVKINVVPPTAPAAPPTGGSGQGLLAAGAALTTV